MTRSRRWALVLAAIGALQTLAFVHTAAWALPLLGAAVLAASAARVAPRRAAWFGWAYGVGWLVAGTWWLFISMYRYGHLPAPLAAAAVLALAAALSLYLAAAMAAFAGWRSGSALVDAGLFAAVWLLAELARGVIFTGFPWVAAGYAQVDGPLAPLAPWLGAYGIGAWGAFASGLLAAASWRRMRPALGALALVLLPLLLTGQSFSRPGATLSVTLLQTNVSQDDKFAVEKMPAELDWVAARLEAARGQLVLAPETAVPLLPEQLEEVDPGYWKALVQRFSAPGRAALIGAPMGDFEHGYSNSMAGLSAAPPYRYDKQHLVPFGEFIPTGFHWFTEAMDIPLGDFSRGVLNPPSFAVLGERIAPTICYEDLFGEELARRFVDPALAPTLFANASNLGWFGDTEILAQHLNISRLRALEFERAMIRSTNTGATAIIDHRGQVTAELPVFTRGTLEGRVQGRSGITPYAWWAARAGLWPLVLAALALILVARRRSSQEQYR